jgi:tetratricopeptide (TPR) repeat protein
MFSQSPACSGIIAPIHRLLRCPELFELIPSLVNMLTTTTTPSSDEIGIDINLSQLNYRINSFGVLLLEKKKYLEAKDLFTLALQLQPEDNLFYYNLACAESLLGNLDEAVKQLRNAVLHGYTKVDHLENDVDFTNIAHLSEFQELVYQLRLNQPDTYVWPALPVTPIVVPKQPEALPKPEEKKPVEPEPTPVLKEMPVKQEASSVKYQKELEILANMGFTNTDANLDFLCAHNGDLNEVILLLVQ